MTVSYASNGEVCMLLVRPDKPTHYADRMATSQMLEEAVKKAVPVDLWGAKSEFEMTVINGCAGFKTTKYENVEVRKAIFSDVNPTCTAQMEVEVKFTHNRCATSHNENISQ